MKKKQKSLTKKDGPASLAGTAGSASSRKKAEIVRDFQKVGRQHGIDGEWLLRLAIIARDWSHKRVEEDWRRYAALALGRASKHLDDLG